jgi:hypothetical protein
MAAGPDFLGDSDFLSVFVVRGLTGDVFMKQGQQREK